MPNHLIDQTSPYLLQHAHNPVDWHPWGETALNMARQQNKPILLSIGYAACHWCHVMERESFENKTIAEVMNRLFVCIKVDREERPDLDKIYQSAHQMLTQRPGGWPLTVALTPQGHAPFFAGTYFPPEPRFNMPGFGELLERIANHFTENLEKMESYHHSFERALSQLNPSTVSTQIPDPQQVLDTAAEHLGKQFDDTFGGLGDAPKFPHPTQLELLLLHHHAAVESSSLPMLEKTLTHMGRGGLYDQLGGGFYRYSVDRQWIIPHFEKMLYDNAQLPGLYCDAYRSTGNQEYADISTDTARWVINEMQQPGGGYASTLDADSEGIEGKFYVWSETDLRAILTDEEYGVVENYFGLYGDPNFEGYWHLNINPEMDYDLLKQNPDIDKLIQQAKAKLLEQRSTRIRPALDDKILTAWNGLMIKGMAKAGRALAQPEFIDSAQRSLDFVRNNLWQNQRLLATCREGKAHLNAYLDDYAFLLEGVMELLQARWSSANLEFAIKIGDAMLEHFEDQENGGFYFTSHDHESLLYSPKPGADDAIPSGNGVAVSALMTLGHLIGDTRYLDSADRALKVFASEIARIPSVYGAISKSLQLTRTDQKMIIIRGKKDDIHRWQEAIETQSGPEPTIFAIPDDAASLPPTLASRKAMSGTVAYICTGTQCSPPVDSLEQLQGL